MPLDSTRPESPISTRSLYSADATTDSVVAGPPAATTKATILASRTPTATALSHLIENQERRQTTIPKLPKELGPPLPLYKSFIPTELYEKTVASWQNQPPPVPAVPMTTRLLDTTNILEDAPTPIHIAFGEFLERLQQAWRDAIGYINSSPIGQQDYFIWRTDIPSEFPERQPTSQDWIPSLLLPEMMVVPPADIVRSPDTPDYNVNIGMLDGLMRKHPDLRHCIIVDDAIYNGQQVGRAIKNIIPAINKLGRRITVHVVVPFVAEHGKTHILEIAENHKLQLRFASHQVIPTLPEEKYLKPTMMYFDHKLADYFSLPEWMRDAVQNHPAPYKNPLEEFRRAIRSYDSKEKGDHITPPELAGTAEIYRLPNDRIFALALDQCLYQDRDKQTRHIPKDSYIELDPENPLAGLRRDDLSKCAKVF